MTINDEKHGENNENKNECDIEHYDGWCPFMEKSCEDIEHKVCKALVRAYEKGFENGYG